MTTAPICSIDCSDYIYRANQLESRASEAHTFADVSHSPEDRQYARDLQAQADSLWNHMETYHPEELKDYFEDLRSY